jgi:serine/threonine protein kinase/TPR repeat protein
MPKTLSFDHYEVLTREDGSPVELGRGAMGITYKAFDTSLRVNVALKVINATYLQSEIARQRFVREARAAAQLRHPNVASVFHLGMSGDAYFYAMEFVDGETVESLIKRGGPVDPASALRITLQVTRALGAAAKHHLVHRDIKPANLMLVKEDDDYVVKVIDFGLAKSNKREAGEDLATLSMGGFVGTAHFASPEQLEEKEIDVRSDIYSLGVTLWYMLAGRAPFGGSIAQVMSQHLHKPPPLDQLEKLPATLRTLVGHMIEKDPAKRPQTPAELRSELEKCLASLQLGATASEQDFPTVAEETQTAAAENKPVAIASPPPANYLRIAGWSGAVLLLIAIALFAFYKLRSVEKVPPATQSSASPSQFGVLGSRTPVPEIVASAAPKATSAAGLTADRKTLLKNAILKAEKYEESRDWPQAVADYVRAQQDFPESDVGTVRLELLLSKLQSGPDALKDSDFDRMREPLTEAAKLDVVAAMEVLGDHLRKRDPKASFNWLCSAAAHGRAAAMREVGLRYSNGAGVERDFVKAAQWFESAIQNGDVAAKTLLAECYLFGKGINKNETKAIGLLKDAAAANEPHAIDQLANCYHKGIGVTQDDKEAFRLWTQAAKLNYPVSLGNLGVLYLMSAETDLGKDERARAEKAVSLFREGTKQNNAFCMFLYARCLEAGTGVAPNPTEATDWYRRSAEAGSRAALDWCRQHNVKLTTDENP